MNDLLAPIYAVYFSEKFNLSYEECVNNMAKIYDDITEEKLFDAEADSYYCFELFLSTMKSNYVMGFDGVSRNLDALNKLIK